MRWTCDAQDLADAVAIVERASSRSGPMVVLSGIRLVAEDGRLTLAATDLTLAIQADIPATIEETGQAIVDAKLLAALAKRFEAPEVQCELNSDGLKLRNGGLEASLHVIPVDDWPEMPDIDGQPIAVPQADLLSIIRQVAFAAAGENARTPVLRGVLVEAEGNTLRMVATNADRLALREIALADPVPSRLSAILPAQALAEVARLLRPGASHDAYLTVAPPWAKVVLPGVQITIRLLEGQYPNYRAVMPQGQMPYSLTAAKDALKAALERVSVIVRSSTAFVRCDLHNGHVRLTCRCPEVGTATEEIPVKYDGPSAHCGFKVQYLLDALNAIDGEEVTLEWQDNRLPARMYPVGNRQYLYVVMPAIVD